MYRELLKSYEPHHIGLYGSSAGGLLTAESIAWFLKESLPLPGAVGLFASGAGVRALCSGRAGPIPSVPADLLA